MSVGSPYGRAAYERRITLGAVSGRHSEVLYFSGQRGFSHGRFRVPLEAGKGSILNVGLLNLVPVTGRLGHVSRGIPRDT